MLWIIRCWTFRLQKLDSAVNTFRKQKVVTMTKPAKMGRPKIPAKQRLSKVYAVRFRSDEERAVVAAIAASGKSQSDWMRDTLLAAARR